MIRVGIVGASGLAGGELLRLVIQHPDADQPFLGWSSCAGRRPAQAPSRKSCASISGW
ncbi:hypothetical protein [Streptomyces sp. AM 2-1-1]|uniref:hypothetical protein n=1 Tax=Streptomyces sp. AM 2-1-1 TaxID=3028709 RepID=UPI0023B94C9F|nr:hypothetical protein [Streptomyces sp. AM 2-1-1]WEH38084.1 hypothetical protein PZB77_00345 [Streptomyces sp. AM 2-1-1]